MMGQSGCELTFAFSAYHRGLSPESIIALQMLSRCHNGGRLDCHNGGEFGCLIVLCLYLTSVHSQVYTYNISTLPPTGFLTPVFEDVGYFEVITSAYAKYSSGYPFSLLLNFDGRVISPYNGAMYASSMQVLISSGMNLTYTFSTPLVLTIYVYVSATIRPGNNSSPLPTLYTYSSDTAFAAHQPREGAAVPSFDFHYFADPNEIVPFDPQPYDFVTHLPATVRTSKTSYQLNGQEWSFYSGVCSTLDAVYLQGRTWYGSHAYSSQRLRPYTCGGIDVGSYTLIPASTLADVTVSASGTYTLNCHSFGDANNNWALIKYDGSVYGPGTQADFIVQGTDYSISYASDDPSPFSDVIWCGQNKTVDRTVTVGPFEPISINRTNPVLERKTGFFQVDVSAGLAVLFNDEINTPWQFESIKCDSPARSMRMYLPSVTTRFAVCQDVRLGETITVGPNPIAFTIPQPDAGYCVVGRGYPPSTQFSSDSSYTWIGSEDGTQYTVTCAREVLYAVQTNDVIYNVTFTLVETNPARYGVTYNINGFAILQYPPSTTFSSLTSHNSTGDVTALPLVPFLTDRRPPTSYDEDRFYYDVPAIIPRAFGNFPAA
ncbi:hypothetical protein PROFUN_16187 [Planoprotostelium fungivorum]|uniref:Uncharacterized protein n=1 Tax=Planoprotostelium fungivorum TaxID=1890364 RepID=A0A2P6MS82_9EUKA|nr:hypothetical protein PROFUN_16187 [Planoprotostelium fungivorum]